jgi:dTDP-4-dehydrorhamnose 3,5-epimerase
MAGEIFDVAVDLRRSSPTFGKCAATTISGGGHRMVWIPPGFAHGYIVLSEHAIVLYKTTDYYAPEHERTILWSDPALGINWPRRHAILSARTGAPAPRAGRVFP